MPEMWGRVNNTMTIDDWCIALLLANAAYWLGFNLGHSIGLSQASTIFKSTYKKEKMYNEERNK